MQLYCRYFHRAVAQTARLALCGLLALPLLPVSALATPSDEIRQGVAVNGEADISAATPRQFLKAFTAIALRAEPRDVPSYVTAAVNLRSDLTPNIAAVAIKVVVKNSATKPAVRCVLVDRIIRAAIVANPGSVVAVVKAAASAAPELRHCVVNGAISAAPTEKDAIIQAAASKTVPFAFLTFSANATSGFSFTAATLNPANISLLGDDTVNSPEQPPTP